MGVPQNGKIYNAATLSVSNPSKEANARRAIVIENREQRQMESVTTATASKELRIDADVSPDKLTYVYLTNVAKNTTSIYNVHNTATHTIDGISAETTNKYYGKISNYKFDVTITLQGTYSFFVGLILVFFVSRIIIYSYDVGRGIVYTGCLCRPVSAVIWLTEEDVPSTLDLIAHENFPPRLIINLYIDNQDDYPINTLRNYGLNFLNFLNFSNSCSSYKSFLCCWYGCLAISYF